MVSYKGRWVLAVSWPGEGTPEVILVDSWLTAYRACDRLKGLGFIVSCWPVSGLLPEEFVAEAERSAPLPFTHGGA